MVCPNCNTESGPSLFCYVCDAYLPSISDGVKASLPSRFGAFLLDVFVFLTLLLVIGLIAIRAVVNVSNSYPDYGYGSYPDYGLETFSIIFFGGGIVYSLLFFWLLARGQTPGKWLMDIRAVDKRNGSEPGLGRMLLRETLGKWVSGCFLGLGWFCAIWDRDTQAWHDKISGTVVLYRHTQSRKLLSIGFLFGALILSVGCIWASLIPQRKPEGLGQEVSVFRALKDQQHLVPSTGSAQVSVLGFRFGESAYDMAERAGSMKFRLVGCQRRSANAPEYVDCGLARDNGDSLTVTFLQGSLQRLDLKFRIENYDRVLKAIERDHGSPRIWEDGPLRGTAEWGSVAEEFDISLGKTDDMKEGWMQATEIGN